MSTDNSAPNLPRIENVELSKLRPTQLTVGMLEVKSKRKRLRQLEKRPGELVHFVLENPIRVVLGPADKTYVIDHHHLALALIREDFHNAPMQIEADFSRLPIRRFWTRMQRRKFVHPINARGKKEPVADLPKDLSDLKNDPYRALAGFVREAGGYRKTVTPFEEFAWADYFRKHIGKKVIRGDFKKALKQAMTLSRSKTAERLPGYLGPSKN
jgi:hypothetical protein